MSLPDLIASYWTVAGKVVIEGESLMMPPARAAAPGGTA